MPGTGERPVRGMHASGGRVWPSTESLNICWLLSGGIASRESAAALCSLGRVIIVVKSEAEGMGWYGASGKWQGQGEREEER
jgi:hypothetical protein